MITTAFEHIANLAELCYKHDIRHVVISPGSRNAPLIMAFDEHPGIKTWLVHDERSAAFFALGIADKTKKGVAIVCTSGSAVLNYAPAIAEAYYRQVPLLVLTADRPLHLVDQGDGQTIRQKNVFQNYIKASFELPDFTFGGSLVESDNIINNTAHALLEQPRGPVHLNIPVDEPLYNTADLNNTPLFQAVSIAKNQLDKDEISNLHHEWRRAKKKMILIGQKSPDPRFYASLQPLLSDPSVAVLVENTANFVHFTKVVHCIDRTLALIHEDELAHFAPDLLITAGGAIVSKKIKAFLRKQKPRVNWRVGEFLIEEDTYQSLTRSFDMDATDFFETLAGCDYLPDSTFGDQWKQRDFLAMEKHEHFLRNQSWNDLKVFDGILNSLPPNARLHMGNSSVIRYCQLFNPQTDIHYYSNRGVSGIDGSTSTAAGFAAADTEHLNVLVSGDISFIYDSNALWNNYLGSNFRMIVINNGGGGIFKILDGSRSVKQRDYFFAPHKVDLEKLCKAFDVNYYQASTNNELLASFEAFYSMDSKRPVVLEVKTFSQENDETLRAYFKFLGKPL